MIYATETKLQGLEALNRVVIEALARGDAQRRQICQRIYRNWLKQMKALPKKVNPNQRYELLLQITCDEGTICVPYGSYDTHEEAVRTNEWARLNAVWIVEQLNKHRHTSSVSLQSLQETMFTWRVADTQTIVSEFLTVMHNDAVAA